MTNLLGVATLLVLGGLVVALTYWLSHHKRPVARGVGLGLATVFAIYCAFVAFALIADNLGAPLRATGVAVTCIFATVGLVLAWDVFSAFRREC
jgi:hypothetical protein